MAKPPAKSDTDVDVFRAASAEIVDDIALVFRDPEALTWESFWQLTSYLGMIGRAYPFLVGDLLNMAELRFKEHYAQLEKSLPHSPHTLTNYQAVAERIPRSRRRKNLSHSVHAEVAYMPPRERDEWLDKAERYDWKREDMRAALEPIRQQKRALHSGSVGDQAVTSKSGRSGQAGLAHEEHPNGVPASVHQGELVPSPTICPHCGRPYDEEEM